MTVTGDPVLSVAQAISPARARAGKIAGATQRRILFWDAYLKNDPTAREALSGQQLEATGVKIERK